MVVTFLGTGTSQGIPVITCRCVACSSMNPHDSRLRTSIHININDVSLVVDTGPDFRFQMLRHRIEHLDAILITHEHNDHIAGLDDVRPYNFNQSCHLPLYAMPRVIDAIKERFPYIFEKKPYPGAPRILANPISGDGVITIKNQIVTPIYIQHGKLPILGFRVGNFCYITDASNIPESEFPKIQGSEILVINALRKESHISHFSLPEAVSWVNRLNIKQAFLTHISHLMGPVNDWKNLLPSHIRPAYDGLIIQG